MHDEALEPEKPLPCARDAVRGVMVAMSGLALAIVAYIAFASHPEFREAPLRFGLIVFGVCMAWSATLAIRSLWAMENDDRAWFVLCLVLVTLHVPMLFCLPAVMEMNVADSAWTRTLADCFVPLFLPLASLWMGVGVVLVRWWIRVRERAGFNMTRRDKIRSGVFWLGILAVPLVLCLPPLLFFYSALPLRDPAFHPHSVSTPRGWRGQVLKSTPRFIADGVVKGLGFFPDSGRLRICREALCSHGFASSDLLAEEVRARSPASLEPRFPFAGLRKKYPQEALALARDLWDAQSAADTALRNEAAITFAILASREELTALLKREPPEQDSPRRKLLLAKLGFTGRRELIPEVEAIARDVSSANRLNAIAALSLLQPPAVTKELWMDFIARASVEQHTMMGEGLKVPLHLRDEVYSRVLESSDRIILRCWFAHMPQFYGETYEDRPDLVRRVLALSRHEDIRVRRGALHVLYRPIATQNIPHPLAEGDSTRKWWEGESAVPETPEELSAAKEIRAVAERVLNQLLPDNNASAPPQNDDTIGD